MQLKKTLFLLLFFSQYYYATFFLPCQGFFSTSKGLLKKKSYNNSAIISPDCRPDKSIIILHFSPYSWDPEPFNPTRPFPQFFSGNIMFHRQIPVLILP